MKEGVTCSITFVCAPFLCVECLVDERGRSRSSFFFLRPLPHFLFRYNSTFFLHLYATITRSHINIILKKLLIRVHNLRSFLLQKSSSLALLFKSIFRRWKFIFFTLRIQRNFLAAGRKVSRFRGDIDNGN